MNLKKSGTRFLEASHPPRAEKHNKKIFLARITRMARLKAIISPEIGHSISGDRRPLEAEGGGGDPPTPSKMIRAIRVIRAEKIF
jgi:hypothetical protein